MLSIRRVLFPTDLSRGAARAFPQAAALADGHGADLHILNVVSRHDPRADDMRKRFPLSANRLGEVLDPGFGDGPPRRPDLEAMAIVQEQVEAAAPADRIVAYADDTDIDLIVMGTHGRRGVERLLIGSVAEEVVRTAPCPVLTVRHDRDARPAVVRRILVPLDFSDASDVALAHATELALTYGAQIDLLHVIEDPLYPSMYGIEPASLPTDAVVQRVENALADRVREDIGFEHVVVEATPGYASTTILDYAEDHDVDLIVIATHGRTGLDRMLIGSVTERVVRRAPGPVFVVKPAGKSLVGAHPDHADAPRA